MWQLVELKIIAAPTAMLHTQDVRIMIASLLCTHITCSFLPWQPPSTLTPLKPLKMMRAEPQDKRNGCEAQRLDRQEELRVPLVARPRFPSASPGQPAVGLSHGENHNEPTGTEAHSRISADSALNLRMATRGVLLLFSSSSIRMSLFPSTSAS